MLLLLESRGQRGVELLWSSEVSKSKLSRVAYHNASLLEMVVVVPKRKAEGP